LRVTETRREFFGHPRGLATLFFTEMWERFSYYGMRALLTLFMVAPPAAGGLAFGVPKATLIYGTYTMSVYMLSIPGGYAADNFLGARRAVLCGGVLIAAGQFILAIPLSSVFFAGLALIAAGTGLLKPNVSSLVGKLYLPDDAHRDAGFSIFYMGINVGAFVAPLVTGWLAQSETFKRQLVSWGLDPQMSWHWGFAAAGLGMLVGLTIYVTTGQRLAHVGPAPPPGAPRPWRTFALVLTGAAALFVLVALPDLNSGFAWIRWGYIAVPMAMILWFGSSRDLGRRRMAAILVFSLASLIFWAVFEQAGSTIALFGDRLSRHELFGFQFPSAWFQSLGPLFVILLAPLFAWGWLKWGDRQPSSPMKFTLGLTLLGLSYLLMVPVAALTVAGGVSPLWLVALFFLQTLGELCVSPIGLSALSRLAPPRLIGLIMGVWFLATALGNKMAGTLAGEFQSTNAGELARFFGRQALAVGACALLLFALVPWVRRLTVDQRLKSLRL
jgi:proton-dependent oligopeptide transporter, POT family